MLRKYFGEDLDDEELTKKQQKQMKKDEERLEDYFFESRTNLISNINHVSTVRKQVPGKNGTLICAFGSTKHKSSCTRKLNIKYQYLTEQELSEYQDAAYVVPKAPNDMRLFSSRMEVSEYLAQRFQQAKNSQGKVKLYFVEYSGEHGKGCNIIDMLFKYEPSSESEESSSYYSDY